MPPSVYDSAIPPCIPLKPRNHNPPAFSNSVDRVVGIHCSDLARSRYSTLESSIPWNIIGNTYTKSNDDWKLSNNAQSSRDSREHRRKNAEHAREGRKENEEEQKRCSATMLQWNTQEGLARGIARQRAKQDARRAAGEARGGGEEEEEEEEADVGA